MLDHCDECGTDFAFGLPVCPNCQVPNQRLAAEAEPAAESTPAEVTADTEPAGEVPAPRRQSPTSKTPDLPDDAPKIPTK